MTALLSPHLVHLSLTLAFVTGLGPAPAPDPVAPTADAPAEDARTEDAPADGEAGAAAAEGETPPEEGETGEGESLPLPDVEPEPVAEPEPEPESAPEPEGPAPEEDGGGLDDGYDPMRDSPEAIRARGWLRSGIVATSVGVALGIGAIVLGTLDPCARAGGNSCFTDARNRAALTAGVPGAVLLAGGVAMISVGVVRLKKLRTSMPASASLHVDREGAVVGLRGRF